MHLDIRRRAKTPRVGAIPLALGALALAFLANAADASTLTFDDLPMPPAATDIGNLVDANGGSRTIGGVTFNAADNADWEIVGGAYQASGDGDFFAQPHSGAYALAGNAFSGMDFFGNVYTGLTITTTQQLTSLYVGFDDTGDGANDASSLTITAFGAGGDLASITQALGGPALVALDTGATFAGLSGITGYRFETVSADDLDAAFGRAYVIADDLSFGAPVPEPGMAVLMMGGLAALAAAGRRRRVSGEALQG